MTNACGLFRLLFHRFSSRHLVGLGSRQETMPSAHRTAPTLETIPTEMKLMVASHLDPDVPLDLRWSQMAQHDAESRRASLRSLSLVSRSWAAALAGLKWQVRPTLSSCQNSLVPDQAEALLPGRLCPFVLQTLIACWNSPATGCLSTDRNSSLWCCCGGPPPTSRSLMTCPTSGELLRPQNASQA